VLCSGVVPALVNYNLRSDPLLHSITVAKCKAIIFSSELAGVRGKKRVRRVSSLKK
jgi:hypothetical protein